MAQYFEPSTDTNANFANSVSGQTNSFFLPSVYSKKVLNFFRKSSVVEAITNTDYSGEISAFGDSVKIIKEPVISVSAYTRNSDTTETRLTDAETSLVRSNITCNKNGIPFDTQSPMITSGIRLGTPACTTRGFGPNEFSLIADLISKVIKGLNKNGQNNSKIEKEVQKEVIDLCSSFPIYSD